MTKYLVTKEKFIKGFITEAEGDVLHFRVLPTYKELYIEISGDDSDVAEWIDKSKSKEIMETEFNDFEIEYIRTGWENRKIDLLVELDELNLLLGT